jgi:mRNA deadenylase 3'-5' endonuclease subunit Ccr4
MTLKKYDCDILCLQEIKLNDNHWWAHQLDFGEYKVKMNLYSQSEVEDKYIQKKRKQLEAKYRKLITEAENCNEREKYYKEMEEQINLIDKSQAKPNGGLATHIVNVPFCANPFIKTSSSILPTNSSIRFITSSFLILPSTS